MIIGSIEELISVNPKVKLEKGQEYPFISMDVIQPYYKPVYPLERKEFKSGGSKFEQGDTLFARITPCLENGKTAQVKGLENRKGFGSTEFFVLRGKEGITHNEFVYYLSIDKHFKKSAKKLMTGTSGRQRVDKQQFLKQIIEIPNLDKQVKIASILKSLDDKIELNNKMNRTLEEMAMTLYKHWFVDYGPFQDGEFVDSNLGRIPKGWEVKSVDSLGEIVTGKTPTTKNKENYGDDVPFIKIPDMHNQIYTVNTEVKLSKEGADKQKTKFLPKESICVSCIATPGLVTLTSTESQTNQQINSIKCYENVSPYYVYLLFRNISNGIISLGSGGTATLNLNKRDFSNIPTLVPNDEVQRRFHKSVRDIFYKVNNNQHEIKSLLEIRDYLLPKLLSGEIDLSEAEEHLEEITQ